MYSKLVGAAPLITSEQRAKLRTPSLAQGESATQAAAVVRRDLDLLDKALFDLLMCDEAVTCWNKGYDEVIRTSGLDWALYAHSMIGATPMRSLRDAAKRALVERLPEIRSRQVSGAAGAAS